MRTNKELYNEAEELLGKEAVYEKSRNFLLRIILAEKQKRSNMSQSDYKKKIAEDILRDLNDVCGTCYKPTVQNLKFIYGRMADGFEEVDFKAVHRAMFSKWVNTDQEQYLRPATLYSGKFEGYLQEASRQKQKADPVNVVKKKWHEFKTLPELIANRKGLDIPDDVKQLFAMFATYRDRGNSEGMRSMAEKYEKKLKNIKPV